MKKQIAFLSLTPLGDAVLSMGELVELRRIYDPCEITVFAIPLIAELFRGFKYCDHVVELRGGIHGEVCLEKIPNVEYDAVFNHGYEPWWTDIVRKLHCRKAYGMEEIYRTAKECDEVFDKWVTLGYWRDVTMKKYRYVSQQTAELIRLVSPEFVGDVVRLSPDNFKVITPVGMPSDGYILFLPGTSAVLKHFPSAKFKVLARMSVMMGYEAVFAVGPQDRKIGEDLKKSGFKVFDSLPLVELAGLVCGASLVVGNDSGPMHFAAAFDRPTIHLFSFSGAHTWFSYLRDRHRLLMLQCGRREGDDCRNCARTCIGKIPLREVASTMADLLGCEVPSMRQVAYFPQDFIGDVLVWINQIEAVFSFYAPCEVTVFCSEVVKGLLEGYAFVERIVVYDGREKWSQAEIDSFGYFDAVFNTRYDADSLERVMSLRHGKAYGFENAEISEKKCKIHYDAYLPLLLWDDFHLRRETSVTAQGAELIKLVDPGYSCEYVRLEENTYVHDFTEQALLPSDRVVFVLGASDRSKHWGTDRYIWLALRLKSQGYTPVFVIGPGEFDYRSEIENAGMTVLENLDFAQIAAVFSRSHGARCVVGNDTGLMHLACMLGSPSVTIVPMGTQFTWFPYADDERAPHICCSPSCARPMCSRGCVKVRHCIDMIEKEYVEEKVNGILHSV